MGTGALAAISIGRRLEWRLEWGLEWRLWNETVVGVALPNSCMHAAVLILVGGVAAYMYRRHRRNRLTLYDVINNDGVGRD